MYSLVVLYTMVTPSVQLRISGSRSSEFPYRTLNVLSFLLLVFSTNLSAAVDTGVRSLSQLKRSQALSSDGLENKLAQNTSELQRFYEVARPITIRGLRKICSMELMYHEFAATYGIDPPVALYTPSKLCKKWDKVVLKWSAVCRGRQFDRIAGVWLGGVEILRTCTAEPTLKGIIWEVEKDVTRYRSLWKRPQELVVAMGNVVDDTYTGIFNVTISVDFYREEDDDGRKDSSDPIVAEEAFSSNHHSRSIERHLAEPAHIILPIKEASYKGGGYWFQLAGIGEVKNVSLSIPRNTYRAVLEVCLSPHQNDEFWYTNPPNSYVEANNLSIAGNGAFREIVISVDDKVAGAVWPFAVLYTGGVNPLFWRPASAIGSFNLPSYDIDITPFVGLLVDGQNHTFSIGVTDNLDMWLVQANLHIWTDHSSQITSGNLEFLSAPSFEPEVVTDFDGLDGTFKTTATRALSFVGHVNSSFGCLTTSTSYNYKFYNGQVLANSSTVQTVEQYTETENTVVVKTAEKEIAMNHVVNSYPLYLLYSQVQNSDGSYDIGCKIKHSLKTNQESIAGHSSSFSSLSNIQNSDGFLYISVNNTLSGIGATQQDYSYEGTDGCYQRTISVKNYTTLTDTESTSCSHTS